MPPENRPSVMSATCLAESLAANHRGRRQHFGHAGAALRSLVADDDDVAGFDLPFVQRGEAFILRVENDGLALEDETLRIHARRFDDRAFRREVAEQHRQSAIRRERRFDPVNDFLVHDLGARDVFAKLLARDGHRVEVQRAGFAAQFLQDGADAARAVHVLDVHVRFRGRRPCRCRGCAPRLR